MTEQRHIGYVGTASHIFPIKVGMAPRMAGTACKVTASSLSGEARQAWNIRGSPALARTLQLESADWKSACTVQAVELCFEFQFAFAPAIRRGMLAGAG